MKNQKFLSSDEVYFDLCNKIEKLFYMPGDRISESELCKFYGVTRHIVRNAITRLKDRKLIEVYPQRGTYVTLIDMGYVEDILYLREAAEQEALRRIIDLEDTGELIEHLEQNLCLQREKVEEEGVKMEEFYQIDSIFHGYLMEAVGKTYVMDIIKEQYIHLRRWRNFEIRNIERLKEIIEDHEKIIKAIRKKDAEYGRKVMHNHLDTVSRLAGIFMRVEPQYFVFR